MGKKTDWIEAAEKVVINAWNDTNARLMIFYETVSSVTLNTFRVYSYL